MQAILASNPELRDAIAFALARVAEPQHSGALQTDHPPILRVAQALIEYNETVLGRVKTDPIAVESGADSSGGSDGAAPGMARAPSFVGVPVDEMDEDEEAEYRARVRAARSRGDGRSAVIAGASVAPDADFEAPVIEKTAEEHAEISGAMASNFIFSGLDEDQRGVLVGAMERRAYSAGETIIRQGDDGDYFYLQASGTCHVLVDGQLVLTTTAGKSFGELALIHAAPRAASVVVAEDSEPVTAWAIGGDTFKHVVMSMAEEKRRRHAEAINRVPLLHGLTDADRAAVMDCLLPVSMAADEVVIAEGEVAPDRFYIVERGELKVTMAGVTGEVCPRLRAGDYFGERALLLAEPRAATVTAVSPCALVALDEGNFIRLLGPMMDLLTSNMSMYDEYTARAESGQDLGRAGFLSVGSSAQLSMSFARMPENAQEALSPEARASFGHGRRTSTEVDELGPLNEEDDATDDAAGQVQQEVAADATQESRRTRSPGQDSIGEDAADAEQM